MTKDGQALIIVKKGNKGGEGGHGGAWKVAFADFAIAMMAFFLLMWLLQATTPQDKKEISGYFTKPEEYSPLESERSTTFIILDSETQIPDKHLYSEDDIGFVKDETLKEALAARERKKLERLKEAMEKEIQQSQTLQLYKDQLLLDITKEGLRIQIIDDKNRPMFASGSYNLHLHAYEIIKSLSPSINQVPNKITITGHTDATPLTKIEGFSNWELSTERANSARRALEEGGLTPGKVARVVGFGSTVLFNKDRPRSYVNRRISIIVLNKETEERILREAGGSGNFEDEQIKRKKAELARERAEAEANAEALKTQQEQEAKEQEEREQAIKDKAEQAAVEVESARQEAIKKQEELEKREYEQRMQELDELRKKQEEDLKKLE